MRSSHRTVERYTYDLSPHDVARPETLHDLDPVLLCRAHILHTYHALPLRGLNHRVAGDQDQDGSLPECDPRHATQHHAAHVGQDFPLPLGT
jgi:hypothetical protein